MYFYSVKYTSETIYPVIVWLWVLILLLQQQAFQSNGLKISSAIKLLLKSQSRDLYSWGWIYPDWYIKDEWRLYIVHGNFENSNLQFLMSVFCSRLMCQVNSVQIFYTNELIILIDLKSFSIKLFNTFIKLV